MRLAKLEKKNGEKYFIQVSYDATFILILGNSQIVKHFFLIPLHLDY